MQSFLKIGFFIFLLPIQLMAQMEADVSKMPFSLALELNIRDFNRKSEDAFYDNDLDRVEALFDSLVENVVKGTYLDNFIVHKKSGRKTNLHRFKKPIFLITYSSWYPFATGEIPALNEVAAKYSKDIDFVVLFWDPPKRSKKITKQFGRKINVVYVDERKNKYDWVIKSMKHSFGIPTAFFIDKDKRLLDIEKMPAHHFKEELEASFKSKYTYFLQGVSILQKQSKVVRQEKEEDLKL